MTHDQIIAALATDAARTPGAWRYWDNRGHIYFPPVGESCVLEGEIHQGVLISDKLSGGRHNLSAAPHDCIYIAATTDPDTGYAAALRELLELKTGAPTIPCANCGVLIQPGYAAVVHMQQWCSACAEQRIEELTHTVKSKVPVLEMALVLQGEKVAEQAALLRRALAAMRSVWEARGTNFALGEEFWNTLAALRVTVEVKEKSDDAQ